MENWKNMLILAGVVVGYFLIMIIAKNVYSAMLARAMGEGDAEKSNKLLFSKLSILLLNHQMLSMMRASFCVSEEKYEEATRYLGMIKKDKLSLDKKMSYYILKMQIALGTKNAEMAASVQEELKVLNEIENNAEIKSVIDDNEIQIALQIQYDPSIIEKLDVRVKTCKNKDEKGLLLINLAKAYHLNKQDQEATNALKRAKEYVTNELTLDVINAALKNPSVMD